TFTTWLRGARVADGRGSRDLGGQTALGSYWSRVHRGRVGAGALPGRRAAERAQVPRLWPGCDVGGRLRGCRCAPDERFAAPLARAAGSDLADRPRLARADPVRRSGRPPRIAKGAARGRPATALRCARSAPPPTRPAP